MGKLLDLLLSLLLRAAPLLPLFVVGVDGWRFHPTILYILANNVSWPLVTRQLLPLLMPLFST